MDMDGTECGVPCEAMAKRTSCPTSGHQERVHLARSTDPHSHLARGADVHLTLLPTVASEGIRGG